MDIEEKKYFIIQNLKSDIIYTLNSHFKNDHKLYSDTYLLLLKEIQFLYKDSKKLSMPTCEHIFKTGSRKGSKCTTIVKKGTLCYKHKIKEVSEDIIEELPVQHSTNRAMHGAKGDKSDKSVAQERSDSSTNRASDKKEIICSIRKNNFNNFVFKNTGLIFKNQKEKFIVAKEGIKGEWLSLSEDDIELCRQNHLRYKIIDFKSTQQQSNIDTIKNLVKLPFENLKDKEDEKN